MNAIYDLYAEVDEYGSLSSETWEKMMHRVPQVASIRKDDYLLKQVKGKIVLDIGCTGVLSQSIRQAAREYHGIDRADNPGIENYHHLDLDIARQMPEIDNLELIIAAEVIEHLSNAGHFLDMVRQYRKPVILTTPNAASVNLRKWLEERSIEQVNREHVAWYSYYTLKNLTERHGFRLDDWFWYNGKPLFAEGMIFYME